MNVPTIYICIHIWIYIYMPPRISFRALRVYSCNSAYTHLKTPFTWFLQYFHSRFGSSNFLATIHLLVLAAVGTCRARKAHETNQDAADYQTDRQHTPQPYCAHPPAPSHPVSAVYPSFMCCMSLYVHACLYVHARIHASQCVFACRSTSNV